jgi:hypothetical protein
MNTYLLTQANKYQEQIVINEILKKNEYQHSITNHKHINKSPTNLSQATQRTQKENRKKNGPPSHILALRPELLLTYFGIQTLKLPTRLPIQLNTT